MRRSVSNLTIPIKGEFFDQIKAGTKPEEFRECTPFWSKRLVGRHYDTLTLTRGYPARTDTEKRLVLPWAGFVVKEITHPFFGNKPLTVFAIDVRAAASIRPDVAKEPNFALGCRFAHSPGHTDQARRNFALKDRPEKASEA